MKDDIATYEEYLKTKKHPILFGMRPEDIHLEGEPSLATNLTKPYNLNVQVAELLGNEYYLHLLFDANTNEEIIAKTNAGVEIARGEVVSVSFDLDKVTLFDDISEKAMR